ncbi:hypothetical protein HK405_001664, partial [Cladochytrium tenue]
PAPAARAAVSGPARSVAETKLLAAILQRRLLPSGCSPCPRCSSTSATALGEETHLHLLYLCPAASLLWFRVDILMRQLWDLPPAPPGANDDAALLAALATSIPVAAGQPPPVSAAQVLLGFPGIRRFLEATAEGGGSSAAAAAAGERLQMLDMVHGMALAALVGARVYPRADVSVAWSIFRAKLERRLALESVQAGVRDHRP